MCTVEEEYVGQTANEVTRNAMTEGLEGSALMDSAGKTVYGTNGLTGARKEKRSHFPVFCIVQVSALISIELKEMKE